MKIRQVLIVGLGHIAKRHARLLKQMRPELTLCGVSKQEPPEQSILELYDRIYRSLEDVPLKEFQAALLCSPAPRHVPEALSLMQSGVHVFIEKPLSHTTDGLDDLREACSQSGVTASLGYVLRHRPDLMKYAELVMQIPPASIERIDAAACSYLPDWRPGRDYRSTVSAQRAFGGGALLELSHEIDYLNWLFGPMKNVSAVLSNSGELEIDVEDRATIVMKSETDLNIHLQLDFASHTLERWVKVRTRNTTYSCDLLAQTITIVSDGNEPQLYHFPFDFEQIYYAQLQEFFACVEEGRKPSVDLDAGITVMRIIEAARSADRRKVTVGI
jgi:predicted dehydrogenase